MTVIKVENLSKKYLLHHQQQERYTALRDVLARGAKNLGNKLLAPFTNSTIPQFNNSTEEFFALKDVSFKVRQGERVGIIGRNGAGKSTLLKILSRITEPTSGRIEITGRVASLLEVGTGFHPELTGRENIFLNGAILGMGKAEIKRKFDEIVSFAEIEKFLDTPVKRYSSGMYVRLAFAVAAHLEPEILIVDEVLAVGDAQFQKKCLGKMEDVGKEGRTVLFVSHNMAFVQNLCQLSVLIEEGRLRLFAPTGEVVSQYIAAATNSNSFERPAKSSGVPTVTGGKVYQNQNQLILELEIVTNKIKACTLQIKIHDTFGIPIGFASVGLLNVDKQLTLKVGRNFFICSLKVPFLAKGHYFVSIQLGIPWVDVYDSVERVLQFDFDRPSSPGMQHVLLQEWNYGCFEIPMEIDNG